MERNWLAVSKLTQEIWQILTWALESLKIFYFNRLLLSKAYIAWAKKNRGGIFHETDEEYEIWRGIELLFQNWHKEFDEFWPEHSKVSRIFILMGSFCTNFVLFELKKYRGIISHHIEEWCKICRKTDLWLGKWHEDFGKFSPEHSKVSKLEFWWDHLENVWAFEMYENLERSFASWQWRMIQKLRRIWLVVLRLTWGTSQILTRTLESLEKLF